MSLNAEPIRQILELEAKKGYLDSAVIGGLDRFLGHWAGQAVASITNPQLLNRFNKLHLVKSNYASLTKEQRQEWINSVLDFLAEDKARATGAPEPVPVVSPPSSNTKRQKSSLLYKST